jgi:hypothetical protein
MILNRTTLNYFANNSQNKVKSLKELHLHQKLANAYLEQLQFYGSGLLDLRIV